MAKRKKAHRRTKTGTRRGGRVSGAMGDQAIQAFATIGGAIAGKFAIKQFAGKVNDKILASALVVGGVFFPKVMRGPVGAAVSAGLIAAGGTALLSSFGVLQGIGGQDDFQLELISGPGDDVSTVGEVDTVGEMEDETVFLNGVDDYRTPGDFPVLAGVDDGNVEFAGSDNSIGL